MPKKIESSDDVWVLAIGHGLDIRWMKWSRSRTFNPITRVKGAVFGAKSQNGNKDWFQQVSSASTCTQQDFK